MGIFSNPYLSYLGNIFGINPGSLNPNVMRRPSEIIVKRAVIVIRAGLDVGAVVE